MSDLTEDMEQIRRNSPPHPSIQTRVQDMQLKSAQFQVNAQPILDAIARHLAAGDPRLSVRPTPDGSPGFVIRYPFPEAWDPEQFAVAAIANGDQFEVSVSDGRWDNSPNVLGNWGHWTDQKTVYAGAIDEARLYEAVKRAFLTWYRRVADPDA